MARTAYLAVDRDFRIGEPDRRLFGTFVEERVDVPCRYGLVKPLDSYNPIRIAFHEWLAMANDLYTAASWRERARYAFGPPGWRSECMTERHPSIR